MKNLAASLVAAQAVMPVVHKNAKANYGEYVTLDELIGKTRPVLNANGLAITQFPAETTTGGPGLRTVLLHAESGESIESTVPLLLNGKHDMQALGGAITYARRYGWAAVLGIANDEDDDGNTVSGAASASEGAGKGAAGGTVGTGQAAPTTFVWASGKHQGKTLADTPDDYISWYAAQGPKEDVRAICATYLEGGTAEEALIAMGASELYDDGVPF